MGKFLVDMHVHSSISPCSKLTFKDILEVSSSYGISGIALTDHNTLNGYHTFKEEAEKYGIVVFSAYELKVLGGELLIYGLKHTLPVNLHPKQTIKKVRLSGGAVVAAHPFRSSLSFGDRIYDLDLDGVEVSDRIRHNIDRKALSAANIMDVAALAGSDAHDTYDIGWCATEFESKIISDEDLVKAIKNKKCKPVLL